MARPATRRRVALATYAGLPTLNDDDALLHAALVEQGAYARPAVWDDPGVDWAELDVIVVRSCWDYHERHGEFLAWVDRVSRVARLENPSALLRWNADKRYLRALERRGVRTVPTQWADAGSGSETLEALLTRAGWREAVVKPAISASAHETWRTGVASAADDEPRFTRLRARAGGALVQPFVPEVLGDGEWSLVFFRHSFSHAALKRPRAGDFRVQTEHGGEATPTEAPAALVRDAAAVLGRAAAEIGIAPEEILYARVDGVARDGGLLLMELECLEPHLFLAFDERAPARLATQVLAGVP